MKSMTSYACRVCGYISQKWLGKCPECGEWGTLEEITTSVSSSKKESRASHSPEKPTALLKASEDFHRFVTHIEEFNRVLGGGIVDGSLVLLSGEPGIGKSTLMLHLCESFLSQEKKVLYVSGEESVGQIAQRAKRLSVNEKLNILYSTTIESILSTALEEKPNFLVIDSVQVMYSSDLNSVPGSIPQIRAVTEQCMEFAKTHHIPILLIGHVTKEGELAGPRLLEHLVDVVLYLEGNRDQSIRILKAFKNRFGPSDEIGIFSMENEGLKEMSTPTSFFIEDQADAFGTAITAINEGSRTFFVEVQALVTYSKFGYPKRTVSGIDLNRLNIILAVLSKYANMHFDSYDVYVSTVGDFKTQDKSVDLAIALALISSKLQKPLPLQTVAFGEIGLTGNIRGSLGQEKRIKEALRTGFKHIITPSYSGISKNKEMMIVKNVFEALNLVFGSQKKE